MNFVNNWKKGLGTVGRYVCNPCRLDLECEFCEESVSLVNTF
jgi:hypothetical protein